MGDVFSLTTPGSIYEELWRRLRRGASEPGHPFRFAVVATVSADGAASARSIVLRRAEPSARELVFCTDVRSPKVGQLRRDPRAAWVFWDPSDRLQLRIDSVATLHVGDEVSAAQWALVPPANRVAYQSPLASGRRLPGPDMQPAPVTSGSEHFCVVVCRIVSIDWLVLGESGHRRARFSGERLQEFEWLAP